MISRLFRRRGVDVAEERQPRAVLRSSVIAAQARQPCDEVRLGLVRVAGEMRPTRARSRTDVRRPADPARAASREKGIGHSRDRGIVEVAAEQRRSSDGQARSDRGRRSASSRIVKCPRQAARVDARHRAPSCRADSISETMRIARSSVAAGVSRERIESQACPAATRGDSSIPTSRGTPDTTAARAVSRLGPAAMDASAIHPSRPDDADDNSAVATIAAAHRQRRRCANGTALENGGQDALQPRVDSVGVPPLDQAFGERHHASRHAPRRPRRAARAR